MVLLVNELNERQTKTNAKKILRMFRQLERQAGKRIQLQSPKLNDMPKSQLTSEVFGDRSARKADAEKECQEIIAALHQLDQKEREVLELTYFAPKKYSRFQIAQQMKYSESRIKQIKGDAYIQFAYAYKNGELLEWR
jgi:ArpU family phage transcriptional regulator